eukprot:gene9510-6677_t
MSFDRGQKGAFHLLSSVTKGVASLSLFLSLFISFREGQYYLLHWRNRRKQQQKLCYLLFFFNNEIHIHKWEEPTKRKHCDKTGEKKKRTFEEDGKLYPGSIVWIKYIYIYMPRP